jgi:protein ImuB
VSVDQPLVVISRSGSKRWISAADTAARKLGLKVGMAASKAQAMIGNLHMVDADPVADAAAVERLALWALRQYSPVVAVDGTDGIVMDTEGADHLQGGEELLISGVVNGLRDKGLTARAAVADTWGAAHALARLTTNETTVVPRGDVTKAVIGLPIHCLRLAADTIQALRILGIDTVGELSALPRAPLTLRFGPEVGRRLDQQRPVVAPQPVVAVEVPEVGEGALHVPHAGPGDPDVGVAPLGGVGRADVVAAKERDLLVHDQHLAVVAAVAA